MCVLSSKSRLTLRNLGVLAVLAIAGVSSGCAMCCHPYDYDYPAYGGATPRADQTHGRVGSAFAPAGEYDVVSEGYEGEVIIEGDAEYYYEE